VLSALIGQPNTHLGEYVLVLPVDSCA